jgi:hypothetical protein
VSRISIPLPLQGPSVGHTIASCSPLKQGSSISFPTVQRHASRRGVRMLPSQQLPLALDVIVTVGDPDGDTAANIRICVVAAAGVAVVVGVLAVCCSVPHAASDSPATMAVRIAVARRLLDMTSDTLPLPRQRYIVRSTSQIKVSTQQGHSIPPGPPQLITCERWDEPATLLIGQSAAHALHAAGHKRNLIGTLKSF